MKIRIIILFVALVAVSFLSGYAQTGNYEQRVNGRAMGYTKYPPMGRWGIVDNAGNLKLSIEYNEPLFMNGKAVITEYGTKRLVGVLDSVGDFTSYPPYYVNASYPFVCDNMLAVRQTESGNWGFLDTTTGKLLNVNISGAKNKNKFLKTLGISGKGVKGSFVFEFVAPFVEGMAAVYSSKTGWHHIDKTGKERFKDSNMKPTLFHSSVHNGECVIFNDKGIVVCKETPDHYAGIINYLENDYEIKDYHKEAGFPYVVKSNASRLVMNHSFQADKYENLSRGDSVILIERPKIVRKKTVKKKTNPTMNDITVELSRKNISAGAKGTAAISVTVKNIGHMESDTLHLTIDVKGTKKEWSGVLSPGASQQIIFYVPAKFSTSSITRVVSWTLRDSSNEIPGEDTVTIRRYKPSRR